MPQILGDLQQLKAELDRQADVEIQKIQREADEKVEEILQQAKDQARQEKADILQEAQSQAQRERFAVQEKLRQEELKARLTERQEILDQVWEKAESELREKVGGKDYDQILHQLLMETLIVLGPGSYQLSADPEGYELLTAERLKDWEAGWEADHEGEVSLSRAEDSAETWGGLMVRDQARPRRVNATFPKRLASAREELEGQVYRKLREES